MRLVFSVEEICILIYVYSIMPVVKFYRPNYNRGKRCGMEGGRNAPARQIDRNQRREMETRILRLEADLVARRETRAWMTENVRLHTANQDGTSIAYRPEADETRQEFHDRFIRYYTPKLRLLNEDISSKEMELERLIRDLRGSVERNNLVMMEE